APASTAPQAEAAAAAAAAAAAGQTAVLHEDGRRFVLRHGAETVALCCARLRWTLHVCAVAPPDAPAPAARARAAQHDGAAPRPAAAPSVAESYALFGKIYVASA